MAETLGLPVIPSDGGPMVLVVLRAGGKRVALRVDELIGEREVVVKGVGSFLAGVPLVGGATILGDGSLGLLMSVPALIEAAQSPAGRPGEDDSLVRRPARVLLVDDSVIVREMMSGVLRDAGFHVRTAVNGEDALRRLRAESFDLVVSDVQMPRMDGLTLSRTIRGDQSLRRLPVVIVTGLGEEEDKRRGMEAGADAYLVKSELQEGDLLHTIRTLLDPSPEVGGTAG
jgi:two-component system chemotaxis sensor kinase CheA